ncbi:MAG: rRNA maturation RNase YbeY [Alphaproteobacteria bacterium]|nr:rRNA maturation RNase YbeY [Alphaproteobacteria bacterium]
MQIDLTLHDTRWRAEIPDVEILTERALNQAKNHPEISVRLLMGRVKDTEVSITLSNDEFVQKLNREYREQDKPTNVLSFPMTDEDDQEMPEEKVGIISFGDIIMAFETVKSESAQQKKALRDHFTHLLIHGFLHLLHFDHTQEEEAQEMERLEAEILATMNIDNPYERI